MKTKSKSEGNDRLKILKAVIHIWIQINYFTYQQNMTKIHSLFLILAIVLPAALAIDCTTVGIAECGLAGSACEYFRWSNGTNSTNSTNSSISANSSSSRGNASCVVPQTCPTSPKPTVWSNATFNCIACEKADSSVCTSCSSFGFIYKTDQGICATCGVIYGSSCTICNATRCIACRSGFTLTNNNQACRNNACNVTDCETCASPSACGACQQGFALFNGRCICHIAKCRVCDSRVCLDCFKGYTLDPSKRSCSLTCIENCDACSSQSTCDRCAIGYVYNSRKRRCEINCAAIDVNCISCISPTICSVCATGFRPNLFGTACNIQCSDSRCITCAPSNNCSVCTHGFRTRRNTTTGTNTCVRDICSIPFCAACATASTCASCVDLYTVALAGLLCVPSCNINNCLACATNTTCQTCVGGFKISSGNCVPSCTISNCLLCASPVTCRRCNEGFLLSPNRLQCNVDCGIPECISCNNLTTCSRCLTGSTLSADNTRCEVSCQRGFYLEPVNSTCRSCPTANCLICDSTARCLTCLDFFYLNTTDFNCYACSTIPNCFSCSQQAAACLRCRRGFSAVNGACVSQASCTVANCETCAAGKTTLCATCSEGFGIANSGASCEALTCPGNQILIGSTCTCGHKAYLSGGSCINCLDQHCLACSSSGCTECAFGFYPSGSFCLPCADPNCEECNSLRCLTCYRGYFRRNGACQPIPIRDSSKSLAVSREGRVISCPPGCQTCDIDNFGNLVCLKAVDGYILLSGAIRQCAINCQTCAVFLDANNVASTCLSCPPGFALSEGACSSCTDANALTCSASNANISLTCKVGHTTLNITLKQSTGTCNACADNCAKCDFTGAGNCDLGGCIPNAVQKSDGCLLCFRGCFKCVGDPNTCIQCNNFYFLDANATCQPCSSNCRTCTSATLCTNCNAGYFLVNNSCIVPTAIPNCVSYDSTFTSCTACDFGYILNSGACALSWPCNATTNCNSCPYGFFLSSRACLSCPAIPNCLSCASSNNTLCIDCAPGFYNNLGTCAACITGCATCTSPHTCTRAASGSFLIVSITNTFSGAVGACAGNCLTCHNSEITCVSCRVGSRLSGTECISDSSKTVTIVLFLKSIGTGTSVSAAEQTGQMYNFLFGFYFRLGRSFGFRTHRQCQRRFRLRRLFRGSVQLETSLDSEATTVDPATAVANTQDDNFGTLGVSVVNNSPSTESTTNLGLILGVSIPLGILLIIIVVLIKVSTKDEDYMPRPVDQTEKEVNEIEAL